MKAYLTFIRISKDDFHLIGLQSISFDFDWKNFDLISGQSVICIIEEKTLLALYLIRNDGVLNQIYGNLDYLFDINLIYDITLINLTKYNSIKFYLTNIYQIMSFDEMTYNYELMKDFENKIFYNFLHTEIKDFKKIILRELIKSNWDSGLKTRMIDKLKKTRIVSKRIAKKKIDLDLTGYSIYIRSVFN